MSILDTISQAWTFINTIPYVWPITVGLLISWFGTQYIKFQYDINTPDADHKRKVRRTAFLLGAIPAFILWPTHAWDQLAKVALYAILVGLASPTVYMAVIKTITHFFPWIDSKVSARPVVRYDAQGDAVGIRMDPTDPNDKTIYFKKSDQTQPGTTQPPTQPPSA